uniref:DGCR14-like protein n=1 Tax=Syphacia muris TaxID=451379 RepID=A0A0N5AXG3_9BILA
MSVTSNEVEEKTGSSMLLHSSRSSKDALLSAKKLETVKSVRTVLPEEEYLEGLEKIIVKDYFPELPKLKAQKEYLDAIASNDLTRVRELQLRYSTKRTERRTSPFTHRSPEVFDPETPGPSNLESSTEGDNISNSHSKNEATKKDSDNLTVDNYLNKFTSEDNASFEELVALYNKKEKIRNSWMYEAEVKHNNELVYRGPQMVTAADEQLMISASSTAHTEKPKDLDNWTYKARNSVLFNVEEAPLTVEEHLQRQKMNQKVINKEATRLSGDFLSEGRSVKDKTGLQPNNGQVGKVDVTGHEVGTSKKQLFELVSTPSPAPGVDESPFMTWGEIEGTPFRLDASDLTPSFNNAPTFKIPEVPVREQIAQEITERIAQRYRNKKNAAIRQAEKLHSRTPSFGSIRSSERLLLMSPAARRLATKGLGIRLGSDKSLRSSYSPSPLSALRTTPSRSPFITRKSFVRENRKATPSMLNTKEHSSITDNLLNFGESTAATSAKSKTSRPTAADFFD